MKKYAFIVFYYKVPYIKYFFMGLSMYLTFVTGTLSLTLQNLRKREKWVCPKQEVVSVN